jgi:hypothetical protein
MLDDGTALLRKGQQEAKFNSQVGSLTAAFSAEHVAVIQDPSNLYAYSDVLHFRNISGSLHRLISAYGCSVNRAALGVCRCFVVSRLWGLSFWIFR